MFDIFKKPHVYFAVIETNDDAAGFKVCEGAYATKDEPIKSIREHIELVRRDSDRFSFQEEFDADRYCIYEVKTTYWLGKETYTFNAKVYRVPLSDSVIESINNQLKSNDKARDLRSL
jgi:hypothetical protein